MSSKFPLVVILAELSVQLRRRDLELDLQWAPRDQNEPADSLTNLDFSGFDPRKMVDIEAEKVQ